MNRETLIGLAGTGVVLIIAAAGGLIGYGALTQRVEEVDERLDRVEYALTDLGEADSEIAALKAQVAVLLAERGCK